MADAPVLDPGTSPRDFGDPASEIAAARTSAALFDVCDRAQLELTGADRARFLHNFCTNDIKRLRPGQGCEAFVTNVKGKVLGHIFVFAGAESLWVESVPGAAAPLLAHLDRYLITEDVALHDRTPEMGELLVSGPQAAERLAGLGGGLEGLSLYDHVEGEWASARLSIRRVAWLGAPGFLLSTRRSSLSGLWARLHDAGCKRAGTDAFHALRVEAGFPLYGVDITEDNLAQEVARTSLAISFTKGCYLGQEPIARIDALGHINRELRMLRVSRVPAPGARITHGDQDAGLITSTAAIPGGGAVALGYLRRPFGRPGTTVAVDVEGTPCEAVVAEHSSS